MRTTYRDNLSVIGNLIAAALAGADLSQGISGQAAQESTGAGGAVPITGGAGGATSGAGGAVSATGGASTSGAGGAASLTGGAGGTAGNGGAASVTGGAGGTSGTGGQASLVGGASAGASGTAGAVNIDTGAASGGTGNIIKIGDTNAIATYLNRGSLKALQVGLTLTALGTTQSSSPTAAQLLGGFLTQTGATGAGAVTLPTGTALSAACARTPAVGDSFDCLFANLGGGQTLTITGATGTTVVSGGAIATAKSGLIRFICTGTNTWSIAVVAA